MPASQFCPQCGKPLDLTAKFCSECGIQTPHNADISPKSGMVTLLLCLFLGSFGIHRFYVGKIGTGILMLLTGGGLGIWTIIDIIFIASCDFTDKQGRYILFKKGRTSLLKSILIIISLIIVDAFIYSVIFMYSMTLLILLVYFMHGTDNTATRQHPATTIDNTKLIKNMNFTFIKENNVWKILATKKPGAPSIFNETTAKNKFTFNLFAAKALKFTIKYPSDWTYTLPNSSSMQLRGKNGTPSFDSIVFIQQIPLNKTIAIEKNMNAVMDNIKQQLNKEGKNIAYLKEDTTTLSTNPKYQGLFFIATYNKNNITMKKLQMIIISPDNTMAYSWSYTASEKQFDVDLTHAQQIYDSWVIH